MAGYYAVLAVLLFQLPFVASRVTNGNPKLCFLMIFDICSAIVLTFLIAAYLVWLCYTQACLRKHNIFAIICSLGCICSDYQLEESLLETQHLKSYDKLFTVHR